MTEIAIREPAAAPAVPDARDTDSWITVVRDIIKIADVIYDTPFVPDGLRGSAPAVAAAMLAGREMGLGIMTSLANIDVIKGKPTQKALLMRAMIQSRGHKWQDVDVSDIRAVVRGCRKGESEWTEVAFTADQAKRAGLDLGRYPADKLYARATSRLARRKFADVIMGMPYSSEEAEDGDVADEAIAEQAAPAIEAPKPAARTARRATAAKEPIDRPSAAPSATASEGATQDRPGPARVTTARSEPDLPPLPGEGEPTDADTERAVKVGIIAQHFKRLGFEDDERDQRLAATGTMVGREVGSTKELTQLEARLVADTLARCKDRGRLIEILNAAEKPAEQGGSDG